MAAALLAALGCVAGCGQDVPPGQTHHQLYAWNCPRAEGGRAFLVLRHQGQWTDAGKSSRVGLIKFRTDPPPSIFEDRYVWGVPTGSSQFVLFDATLNRILRRTEYIRQIEIEGETGESSDARELLVFADKNSGAIEVVRPDGRVVVSARAGFNEAKMAFQKLDGTPVLHLTRGDGQWELRDADGDAVEVGPVLSTLQFDFAVGP